MELGSVAVAYREERFVTPHIQHLQVDDKIVLNSSVPWFGEVTESDETAKLAKLAGARVIRNHWQTEHDQRNTGQALHEDKDWVIILDPDEFLDNENWDKLKSFLETAEQDAYVCEKQNTYWKDGWVAEPPEDYTQIIAVRPWVKFVDKRVVGTSYGIAPVELHHFSWARTDDEVLRKVTHYSEQHFDSKKWYEDVWLKWKPGVKDVHPSTPSSLHDFKRAALPKELGELNLWPK